MSTRCVIAAYSKHSAIPPRALLVRIKNKVVGKDFSVCIVFAGPKRLRALNKKYRQKSYTPNVLAFRMGKKDGEVFVCPEVAAREPRAAGIAARARVAYLVIHGLLHLKGMTHGATMSKSEKRLCAFFKLPEP